MLQTSIARLAAVSILATRRSSMPEELPADVPIVVGVSGSEYPGELTALALP